MKNLVFKLLTNIGFIVTAVYAVFNLLAATITEYGFSDNVWWIADIVLGIDVFTWIIYGVFSIATFLIKLWMNSKNSDSDKNKKLLDVQSVMHFLFMLISFGGIYYLFENSF